MYSQRKKQPFICILLPSAGDGAQGPASPGTCSPAELQPQPFPSCALRQVLLRYAGRLAWRSSCLSFLNSWGCRCAPCPAERHLNKRVRRPQASVAADAHLAHDRTLTEALPATASLLLTGPEVPQLMWAGAPASAQRGSASPL